MKSSKITGSELEIQLGSENPNSSFSRHHGSGRTRLAEEAKRLRAEAKLLPPGAQRDEMIRKARQADITSHLSEWLTSPGLRPPE